MRMHVHVYGCVKLCGRLLALVDSIMISVMFDFL